MSTEPTDIAPHVDAAWVDDFVVELRLRDVPGDVIGDALTEVESHVVDAGTTAEEAFGDPARYAATLAQTAARPTPDDPRDMLPIAVGGPVLIAGVDGLVSWLSDGTVTVTGGLLALAASAVVLPFVVQRHGTAVLRYLIASPFWRIWLVCLAVTGAQIGLVWLGRGWHVATWPAAPVTVVAGLVLAATAVTWARRPVPTDPVLAPGADREAVTVAARRDARRLALRTTALHVAGLAAVVTVAVLVVRQGG
ncbi:HAAS signaling domain-containing protein [Cellulomonas phragmiteti]|uniref:Uncharacterized protein n=1 Tax=Cellulomonas phragmiteti TaxID=478780 RepID=A0ABQ4DP55_9CELL|nr:hypothetical protein [Cellulomonas phragmiteti]GIG40762.1 hypothetical protein Cph01nite_25240 [Cellulomonas phragmiteti]